MSRRTTVSSPLLWSITCRARTGSDSACEYRSGRTVWNREAERLHLFAVAAVGGDDDLVPSRLQPQGDGEERVEVAESTEHGQDDPAPGLDPDTPTLPGRLLKRSHSRDPPILPRGLTREVTSEALVLATDARRAGENAGFRECLILLLGVVLVGFRLSSGPHQSGGSPCSRRATSRRMRRRRPLRVLQRSA